MQDFIYVKDGREMFQVYFSDLQYLEYTDRYVRFVTVKRSYMIEGSLCEVESQLPAEQFCRIHRSYIVSFRHARQLDAKMVSVAGRQLPIGKRYRGILMSKISMICIGTTLTKRTINNLFNRQNKG